VGNKDISLELKIASAFGYGITELTITLLLGAPNLITIQLKEESEDSSFLLNYTRFTELDLLSKLVRAYRKQPFHPLASRS
jgi:hypothetical protein